MPKNKFTPKNFNRMRNAFGYNQGELSGVIKVPSQYISRYERNDRLETFSKIGFKKMKDWFLKQDFDLKTLPKAKRSL